MSLTLNTGGNWWWELAENCVFKLKKLRSFHESRYCKDVVFYVFSGKRIPGLFQYFTTRGYYLDFGFSDLKLLFFLELLEFMHRSSL